MYTGRSTHIGALMLAVALAACSGSDTQRPLPLGLVTAEAPSIDPLDRLAESTLVQDTAYAPQGSVVNLVGAVVNVDDGAITNNGVNIGILAAPGPVGPTGGTGAGNGSGGAAADKPVPGFNQNGPQLDVWCMVGITYYVDTGEIIDIDIIHCWNGDGNGGGGSNNSNNNQTVRFTLSCPASVTRGSNGRCLVSAVGEDGEIDTDEFSFSWSSSLGATASGKGMGSWDGTATENATVTVTVGGQSQSKNISVESRLNWSSPQVYARWYFSRTRTRGNLGLYDLPPTPSSVSAASEGGGPWKGRYFIADPPEAYPTIWIHDDYSNGGQDYSGSAGICGSTLSSSANYYKVNDVCSTLPAWGSFRVDILTHERDHEAGVNACLRSAAARTAMSAIESVVGDDRGTVTSSAQTEWSSFYRNSLNRSGFRASAYNNGNSFRYRRGGVWRLGYPGIRGENGQHSC